MELFSFELANAVQQETAAALWHSALGDEFALGARAWAFQLHAPLGAQQAGQFAVVDGERVGFVLASILDGDADILPADMGWLDALVVAPSFQGRGIGRALLAWAEGWLRGQGRTRVRVGGGLRYFAPGVAGEWNVGFFDANGYVPRAEEPMVQDFGRDLTLMFRSHSQRVEAVCRPAQAGDVDGLRAFLAREFPGRWAYEFEQHLRDGARVADYFVLVSERGIEASCAMTFEDSVHPIERYYPSPLPRPWGQVGTVGVSADRRNAGYGSTLLDAALRHMRGRGVRGCVIDWTHHVGYYERFGFTAKRAYRVMVKGGGPGTGD